MFHTTIIPLPPDTPPFPEKKALLGPTDKTAFDAPAWAPESFPLYMTERATSSLDVAHELARRNLLPEWGSVLALSQTEGRGQLRREWVSCPGNIYAALRLPTAYPLNTEAAAPAVGGLVAEALTRMGYNVALKWPNDILQKQTEEGFSPAWRKTGGILLEEKNGVLLAGMGINLAHAPAPAELRTHFSFSAGCLQRSDGLPDATPKNDFVSLSAWWARLAGAVFSCYFQKSVTERGLWWPELAEKHLAFRGDVVRLEEAETFEDGVVEGLCASGALRLRTKSGVKFFLGGSIGLPPPR